MSLLPPPAPRRSAAPRLCAGRRTRETLKRAATTPARPGGAGRARRANPRRPRDRPLHRRLPAGAGGAGGGGGRGTPRCERPAAPTPCPPPQAARWFAPRRALGRRVGLRLRGRAGKRWASGRQLAAGLSRGSAFEVACASGRNTFWRDLRRLFSSLPRGRRGETPKFSALPRGLPSQPARTRHCTPHFSAQHLMTRIPRVLGCSC